MTPNETERSRRLMQEVTPPVVAPVPQAWDQGTMPLLLDELQTMRCFVNSWGGTGGTSIFSTS